MVNKKLKGLCEIATMISDAELAHLRQREDARRQAASKLTDLKDQQQKVMGTAEPDSALAQRQLDAWLKWCKFQQQELKHAEAIAAAYSEEQRKKTAKAFGRAAVLKKLSDTT